MHLPVHSHVLLFIFDVLPVQGKKIMLIKYEVNQLRDDPDGYTHRIMLSEHAYEEFRKYLLGSAPLQHTREMVDVIVEIGTWKDTLAPADPKG